MGLELLRVSRWYKCHHGGTGVGDGARGLPVEAAQPNRRSRPCDLGLILKRLRWILGCGSILLPAAILSVAVWGDDGNEKEAH